MDERPNKVWYVIGPRLPWWRRGRALRAIMWFKRKVLRQKPVIHEIKITNEGP